MGHKAYQGRTVRGVRELFLQDIFDNMDWFERGVTSRPVWEEMSAAERHIVTGAFPDLAEMIEAYAERYRAIDSHVAGWERNNYEAITTMLPGDCIGDSSDPKVYLTSVDSDGRDTGHKRLSHYLDSNKDTILEAQTAEDLKSMNFPSPARQLKLVETYEDWQDRLWDVISIGDISAREWLQEPEDDEVLQSYAAEIRQMVGEYLDDVNRSIDQTRTVNDTDPNPYAS